MKKINLKRLISQMTREEKIFQLTQLVSSFYKEQGADIPGPMGELGLSDDDLHKVGSVLGTACAEDTINIQSEHLLKDRNKIPFIFMRDVIHGFGTIYPIPLAMGCSFDPQLVEECAAMAAEEASAGGIQVTFNPMVDYVRDARWGRVMETTSEDPYLNSVMGAVQVRAYQGDDISKHGNIAACVKHFACYGAAEAGRDYNSTELSERHIREFHLPSFKACIDAGVKLLMPAFNELNGIPCIVNSWLMKKILRRELGYKGLVISDWSALEELTRHAITKDRKETARLGFENGCDIEMMSTVYHRHLSELIEEGIFTEKQLDNIVYKILRFKEELGLFDDPFHGASPQKEKELILCDKHREIARRAAEETAVLLKNDGTLPLSKKAKKIALIGPFASSKSILGAWSCSGKTEDCISVEMGVRELLPDAEVVAIEGCSMNIGSTDRSGFSTAIEAAKNADAVILCLGESDDYSGESNSRTDLTLPGVQTELAKEVIGANPNTAVIIFNGRPLVLTELSKVAPAILDMWFPGTEGGRAAARLVFGDVNPSGKLSMSFPKSAGQCPIYYNYYNTGRAKTIQDDERQRYASGYVDCGNLPLYFFGQGLSYTDFEYDSMILSKKEMTASSHITVSVKVRNTGKYAGKETVQLYIRDLVSTVVRPVQELKAFSKIYLEPGEEKTVTFEITEPMLRMWNFENKLVSEPGEFSVSVGYANHMKFTETFILN